MKKESAQPVSNNSAGAGHQAAARPCSWSRALLVITCVWAPPSGVPGQRTRGSAAGLSVLHLTDWGVCVQLGLAHKAWLEAPNRGLSSPDTQSGSSCPSRACSRKPDMLHTQLQVLAGAMSSSHTLTRQCCTHLQASECNAPVDVSISVLGFL